MNINSLPPQIDFLSEDENEAARIEREEKLKEFTSPACEAIKDVFTKTEAIIGSNWVGDEHPYVSNILYYLSLLAGYLKSEAEAKTFELCWHNNLVGTLKEMADSNDWLNQWNMLRSHLAQALKEESVHHPDYSANIGVLSFYENKFPSLYEDAKKESEDFYAAIDAKVKGEQDHHEEVFRTQENWEAAFMRGDPAAFCD